ncbi:biosynthetic arginine decarboxylase [Arhodomonas aquaeolei]|uniref:biosynthetic arginine decarboxylase n=1 Tax=Arhodomonas aquaeolei TaxID=2369 RepID=UPI0021684490|nr:biosynthetic arginine decarboxylase [Arhodomonas aquaeolei]MCS4505915.1 biosynthetic arginine decarboxylase [Arhodomonas aquaeolei]
MPHTPAETARETYNVAHWGEGYFDVTDSGRVVARPRRGAGPAVDLYEVVEAARRQGLDLPVLVRFVDILHDRVQRLCTAFAAAMAAEGYGGRHTAVYPIKVNQQRRVVEEIVAAHERVGLEAGSKPELMAVLAVAPAGARVICNGYKDREYVRLALRARQLGLDVHVVVEKLSELTLLLEEADRLGVAPALGVRIRLASIGEGMWQNTGGERSKFGLTAAQALAVVDRLAEAGHLDALGLVHFHLGSQIPNIGDIQRGMREAVRHYAALRGLGAPVHCVDVGGGLGVDYEGTRSRSFCSMNYSLEEYAANIVRTLREVCDEQALPHPDVVTESGRAMTAHHAVLVTDVIDVDGFDGDAGPDAPEADAPAVIRDLWQGYRQGASRSPLEVYHDACNALEEAQGMYNHGLLGLAERAQAERYYQATCRSVLARLDPSVRAHREVLDTLRERQAGKLFANLSLFQSMPDIWAIDQIFPILPVHRLDEPLSARAVLQDLTCDSDGAVHLYVDRDGVESTLRVPPWRPGTPLVLGVFLVGAYQEILGDMHNLFGDTDAVNVVLENGGWRLSEPAGGESVAAVLRHVHFEAEAMLQAYRRRVDGSGLDEATRAACLRELGAGLQGSTYLRDRGGLP